MIGVRSGIDEYGQPSEFVVSGYVGEFKYFGFETVPPHCLACDGSEVSRETYNELFAVFGETFGAGDGVSTFNLPDLRGAFLRCIGGNAAELGAEQGDAIRNITGALSLRQGFLSDSAAPQGVVYGKSGAFYDTSYSPEGTSLQSLVGYLPTQSIGFSAEKVVPTAAENRPVNYAVNICIVYE